MASENEFLLHAFLMGIYITFVYDILRIFRRVIPHKDLMVSLEDLVFWIYCAVKVFLLMYHESNGTMRWFAVLGAITGMFLYRKLVSPFFVKSMSTILRKILAFFMKALRFLLRPIIRLVGKLREKLQRAARRRAVRMLKRKEQGKRFLKKQLTSLKKVHKMNSEERDVYGKNSKKKGRISKENTK